MKAISIISLLTVEENVLGKILTKREFIVQQCFVFGRLKRTYFRYLLIKKI